MNTIKSSYYLYKGRLRTKITKAIGREKYTKLLSSYAGKQLLAVEEVNKFINDGIISGNPFMASRFGSTELNTVGTFYFQRENEFQKEIEHVCFYSGFFPCDKSLGMRFTDVMVEACNATDFLAVWYMPYEDFFVKTCLGKEENIGYLTSIEPWRAEKPWTTALKGKKVLVVHPFEESIQKQYQNRKFLFKNEDILPDFELKTLKAVQTLAGTKDDRFETWFDALQYMYEEAMKIDFDVAILGCGAYGMPLAAMLKKSGKQAIHMGGVTQILFGIKGKRWEEEPAYRYIRDMMNDYWAYPLESERPKKSDKVENNCYW